jgi:hypothetical protein
MKRTSLLLSLIAISFHFFAQEEDYSIYDDYGYADGEAKTFASAKIIGLSPNRFINVAYDLQSPYTMELSEIGSYAPDGDWNASGASTIHSTGGLRFNANIPVISRNNIIWQMGANYMSTNFNVDDPSAHPILEELDERVLHTSGLFTTVYKPLDETQFLLFQGQADYSGDYVFSDMQPLYTLRYSAAALWGKRPHDRLQWAIGIARTYRVGALNYVPIALFNWTSKSEKWGTEILFPARAHGRYTFNKKSLILFGYELEGNSYHMDGLSSNGNSFEIRRGEIRPRIEWNRQLVGYFWINAQIGARINYSFDSDELPDGREFYRGFFGTQEFSNLASLGTSAYALIGISFVSL